MICICKGCAGDSVAHICFQAPLCGETARSKQGICNHPPLVILTVFGHVCFRLRETWISSLHFHDFCNVFLAEFCSSASKKYTKYGKLQWCLKKAFMWGGWDMAETWKHTKIQIHVHFLTQCTWQKSWKFQFLLFRDTSKSRFSPTRNHWFH